MRKSRMGAALVATLVLSGCAGGSYDGYVHAECDPTVTTAAGKVTTCRSTEKPVPTQTVTVTPTPAPTATTPPPTATPTPTPTPTQQAGPTNLRLDPAVAVTTTSFRVLWDAVAGVPSTNGYKVYKNDVQSGTSSDTGESFSGLTAGTTYKIGVSGVVNGVETQITSANFTTATASPSPTPTPTPTATTPPPPTGTNPTPAGLTGTLAFSEDFNGTSLDKTKWSPHWFQEGGSMNNSPTYERNVSVVNGELVLTLAAANSGALIDTDPKQVAGGYQFEKGIVEARVWMPGNGATNGIYNWPAWWTTGQSWQGTNEIDIAEGKGNMWVNYMNSAGQWFNYFPPGVWSGAWHTWTMQRLDNEVKVWIDGTLHKTFTNTDSPVGKPHYLVLNVGSGQGPAMYGAGSQMKVDYVRAWK